MEPVLSATMQVVPQMVLFVMASRSVRLYVATHAAVIRLLLFALVIDLIDLFLHRPLQKTLTRERNEKTAESIYRWSHVRLDSMVAGKFKSIVIRGIPTAAFLMWVEWDGIATAWACVEIAPKIGRALEFGLRGLVGPKVALLLVAMPWLISVCQG